MSNINKKKLFITLGMIGVIAFFIHILIGNLIRPVYNPKISYISELTADGMPFVGITRTFLYASNVLFAIFVFSMACIFIKKHNAWITGGLGLLLLTSLITFSTFGLFPMTADKIFNGKNYAHYLFTTILMCSIILSLVALAIGYSKQDKLKNIGKFSTVAAVLFTFFNILHWAGIQQGWVMLGLVQRLAVYTFYSYIFALSWIYTFRVRYSIED